MESLLSGVLFDGERGCDELMIIYDAVSCHVDLLNYSFELIFGQVGVTLTHGCPQLFHFNCAAVVRINLVKFFA